MAARDSLWPGVFGWAVVSLSGFSSIFAGAAPHSYWWVPMLAGMGSVIMAGVQLWPTDTPRRRGMRVPSVAGRARRARGRRCRARDPQRCRHPRCPEGHGVKRGGLGG